MYQEDNARSYYVQVVRNWFEANFEQFHCMIWSPEMIILECTWNMFEKTIRSTTIQFWDIVTTWLNISCDHISLTHVTLRCSTSVNSGRFGTILKMMFWHFSVYFNIPRFMIVCNLKLGRRFAKNGVLKNHKSLKTLENLGKLCRVLELCQKSPEIQEISGEALENS